MGHITCAPATNRLAERAVQTFKNSLKKATTSDVEPQLARFLFHYRNTAHTTTGVSQQNCFLSQPRTHHTLTQPSISARVQNNQFHQQGAHDVQARDRQFELNAPVYAKDLSRSEQQWLPGTISQKMGPRLFLITLLDGRIIHQHIEHIRTCEHNIPEAEQEYDFTEAPTQPLPLRKTQ